MQCGSQNKRSAQHHPLNSIGWSFRDLIPESGDLTGLGGRYLTGTRRVTSSLPVGFAALLDSGIKSRNDVERVAQSCLTAAWVLPALLLRRRLIFGRDIRPQRCDLIFLQLPGKRRHGIKALGQHGAEGLLPA